MYSRRAICLLLMGIGIVSAQENFSPQPESSNPGKSSAESGTAKSIKLVPLGKEEKLTGNKFSKTPRGAIKSPEMDNIAEISPKSKAIVPMEWGAKSDRYAKLAKLPPIAKFFFETPDSICLPDDRIQRTDTSAFPWSANCQLVITMSNGQQAIGTGWFYGPKLVVTAGHCVHEGEGGNHFSSIEVIPGMSGTNEPFGSKSSGKLRASAQWKSSGSMAHDYGAIILSEGFQLPDGKKPGVFSAVALSDAALTSLAIRISGYPGDKPFGTQWFDSGSVMTVNPQRLHYTIDTFGGHSGSAVIRMNNNQPEAVGIHNYGGCPNRCTRITAEVKADLDQWLAESNAP